MARGLAAGPLSGSIQPGTAAQVLDLTYERLSTGLCFGTGLCLFNPQLFCRRRRTLRNSAGLLLLDRTLLREGAQPLLLGWLLRDHVPRRLCLGQRLLSIPGEEYETFKRWTDAFLSFESFENGGPERQQDLMQMLANVGKMIAARRERGAGDLITALVEAEIEGERLQEWAILGFAVRLLVAGNETTTNLIGNMLNILAHRPDLWQQLRDDRSLVEPVIEETLRYESPVRMLFRNTTRAVEVGGATIRRRQRWRCSTAPPTVTKPSSQTRIRSGWTAA